MLPVLEGIIARRILINFRAAPSIVSGLIPPSLEVITLRGSAVIGVCLIRLEQLRVKGFPELVGISSENMAHRIAVRFPEKGQMREGVFIWRRDTDQKLISLLGGRLFPGVHQSARFEVFETPGALRMQVETKDHAADVDLQAQFGTSWKSTPLFPTFDAAVDFFRKGDCGYSCSLYRGQLEGMRLQTLKWGMEPITVPRVKASFYRKLPGSLDHGIEFDCALAMRGIPHEWHEMSNIQS